MIDRVTIEQLDRMEAKIDNLTAGTAELLHNDSIMGAINILQQEVYTDEGELAHLKDDVKLKAFLDELIKEVDDEVEVNETEGKSTSALNIAKVVEEVIPQEEGIHNKPKGIKPLGIDEDEYRQ